MINPRKAHISEDLKTLLRLPQVLEIIPVSKSTWWAGVASGRFPSSVKIGPKTTAWRAQDIYTLIDSLEQVGGVR